MTPADLARQPSTNGEQRMIEQQPLSPEIDPNAPAPWRIRKMRPHFAVEAANGVRVAEIRFSGRPDGSTSEVLAAAIAALPELVAAAEALLWEDGFDRFIAPTTASIRMRAAIAAVRGQSK